MDGKKWYTVREYKKHSTVIVHDVRENVKPLHSGGKYVSVSCGFDTKEELEEHYKIPKWKCSKCGGVVELSYHHRKQLEDKKMCFSCDFWDSKVKSKNGRVIINSECYYIKPDNPNAMFKGHGGRSFKIRILDTGEVIHTKNLWNAGGVPDVFKNELPDNAEFMKP
jgi:hypothetical protein